MVQNLTSAKRPRLAAVVTAYRKYLHPQHVVDRFLDGYGWGGTYHHPQMDVVALYVDQRGEGDVFQDRLDRHPSMKLYPTIAEAVTRGTSKLAVDGVVVVGEHGNYPLSPTGIPMHPHFKFFEAITQVFRDSGRSVPYFNDKELSWKWDWCKQMVDTSHELGFPLQGGSSLAVTWRVPSVEFPLGATVHEALAIGYGGMTSYDFHVLETIQCMVERRKGGETGVKAVQLLEGDDVWAARKAGRWSEDLMSSALSRSDTPLGLTVLDGRTQDLAAPGVLPQLVKDPAAYCIEYTDGTRASLLMLNGAIRDFNISARVAGHGLVSTQFFMPPAPNQTYSACLATKIEQMYQTRNAPYPVQRTLLTTGLLEACLSSRYRLNQRVETPQLAISYHPPAESQYART